MKFGIFSILLFLLMLSFAFSKSEDEKSATFIVTGNVRAEPNLCG